MLTVAARPAARWLALPLCAAACATPAPDPGADLPVLRVVEDGRADPRFVPLGWRRQGDLLVGEPRAQPYLAPVAVGPGPLLVEVRLALADLGHSAAALCIGESRFGLSGEGDLLFLEGPLFGGGVRHLPVDSGIRAGSEFELRLARRRGRLRLFVDGRLVHEQADAGGALGDLALRPHRDRLWLRSWTIAGALEPVDPPLPLTEVWRSGDDGYAVYRIPALAVAGNGDLLAFAEGRKLGAGDSGDIDLVMKRSRDGGQTFSEQRVLWDDGPNTCGNPCPVLDRRTGTLWLLATHNLGGDHEREIVAGSSAGTRTVWVMSSSDDGETWTAPREITASVKAADWTWYATGPGAGIQLERGPHRGRLVVPCDHIEAATERYFSHVILSDDGGRTWRLGGSTPRDRVNECEVVELTDGRLMLNMRNYDRAASRRQVAFSADGGESWTGQRHDPALVEPICQASIRRLRWPDGERPGVLLFSNPASPTHRVRMTLRVSYDDGATWASSRVLYRGGSAYSCLAALPDGDALCLFEVDDYGRIVAARVSVEPAQ